MKPIDDMTLPEIEAKIEGMGFIYEYNYKLSFPECVFLIIKSPDRFKLFRETFRADTKLDAGRAALKFLGGRKGK